MKPRNTNIMAWKDGTFKTKNLRIQITNKHIRAKGVWVMHVREFGWDTLEIGIEDVCTQEQAQKRAISLVKVHLHKMLQSLAGA